MSYQQDPILTRIIDDLIGRYSDEIIAIYGIGSYFDEILPDQWIKNDVDIIVFGKSLKSIPKHDWTEVRYESKEIDGHHVWIGFNTIQAYRDRYRFSKESFSNYEWSLIELKYPENSRLIYGKDIRDQLPSAYNLEFDYDDVLARSLYHLDKSLSESETSILQEFSKAVFKLAFFLCIFIDKSYRRTSIIEIGENIKDYISNHEFLREFKTFFEDAILFRITRQYRVDFNELRKNFVIYLFSLLEKGLVHKKCNYHEIVDYLTKTYSGFPYLLQEVNKLNLFNYKKLGIVDLTLGIRTITISGYIKEIFGVYKFKRDDGTEGKVGSFLLYDSTGDIRVVLWDDQVKYIRKNDFNVGKSVVVINGYTKQGKDGLDIELHVSSFGSLYLLPEDRKVKKAKEITKQEVSKRLDFIDDKKSIRIPCPYCGFLCPPDIKKCRKCGEPLPKN